MKIIKKILILAVFAVATAFTMKTDSGYKVGDVIEDFNLKNIDGKMVSLNNYASAKGFILVFT